MDTGQIPTLHQPVLLERTLEELGPALAGPESILVDCTLGLGGHSEAFLDRFPLLTVVGIDRDQDALKLAGERLARFGDRVQLAHAEFDEIDQVLDDLEIPSVQGILLDLGVSSMQLDMAQRGFAYSYDAPLDMRMDQSSGLSAADVVNTYSEAELARIFREFGEERFSNQIARAIVSQRQTQGFETSSQLAKLIIQIVPFIPGKSSGHPAKRVFQALRIEVNRELEILQKALPIALGRLAIGGRILVLSYHSLEDRIVKQVLTSASVSSTPLDMPIELPEHAPTLRLVIRGAEVATPEEIASNPRAASVRMRVAEKIRQAA